MIDAAQILNHEISKGKAPSVQYYIFNENSILFSFTRGLANINEQKAIDANTTYNAFSVTKTFTALAVLQLAEKGKLDLNIPVINYLPHFPYGKGITVKHLLNHTAGIPNPIPLPWIHTVTEHETFDRNSFFKHVFERHKKTTSSPNHKFAYSNLGYVVLGQIIEKITGISYEEYIQENILQKLEINAGDLSFNIPDYHNHATGYHKKMSFSNLILGFFINRAKFMGAGYGPWRSFMNYHVNGAPYGGLIGKPLTFVKYIRELLNHNSDLISDEYKALLFQENKTNNGKNSGMCMSWFAGQLNGNRYYAHAGGGGYYCEIRIYPEIKTGSVIFFNRTGMSDERFLDKIDKFYLTNHRA